MTNRLVVLGTCLLTFSACNQLPQDHADSVDGETGEVELAVTTIPSGVAALVIKTMSGLNEANHCFNVTAGASAKVTMPGLPAGQVTIVANAYNVACTPSSSTAASWLSDPTVVAVMAGGTVSARLVMRKAGKIDVTVDFSSCASNLTQCLVADGSQKCVDLTHDVRNCGECRNACMSNQSCTNGVCTGGATCSTGLTMCVMPDGTRSCVDLTHDQGNCGSCGNACSKIQSCTNGVCVSPNPCSMGLTQCQQSDGTNQCVDLTHDVRNCGGCRNACMSNQMCTNGVCTGGTTTCSTGLTQCQQADGTKQCVDLTQNSSNCGMCGHACLAFQNCVSGVCTGTLVCVPGLTLCTIFDGSMQCVDFAHDTRNCGSCRHACMSNEICSNGMCALP
jgi:hypothetical protein